MTSSSREPYQRPHYQESSDSCGPRQIRNSYRILDYRLGHPAGYGAGPTSSPSDPERLLPGQSLALDLGSFPGIAIQLRVLMAGDYV